MNPSPTIPARADAGADSAASRPAAPAIVSAEGLTACNRSNLQRCPRFDLAPAHRQPSAGSVVVATVASLVGSLAADALLVVIGQAVFPSTKGYSHFQFSDYSKLTVIGVIIACLAWPVVTRISSAPRWLFLRMAIAVTLVLWLPDVYILAGGAPAKAVAVLFVMHLAIALVTYNALVHIARTKPTDAADDPVPGARVGTLR